MKLLRELLDLRGRRVKRNASDLAKKIIVWAEPDAEDTACACAGRGQISPYDAVYEDVDACAASLLLEYAALYGTIARAAAARLLELHLIDPQLTDTYLAGLDRHLVESAPMRAARMSPLRTVAGWQSWMQDFSRDQNAALTLMLSAGPNLREDPKSMLCARFAGILQVRLGPGRRAIPEEVFHRIVTRAERLPELIGLPGPLRARASQGGVAG